MAKVQNSQNVQFLNFSKKFLKVSWRFFEQNSDFLLNLIRVMANRTEGYNEIVANGPFSGLRFHFWSIFLFPVRIWSDFRPKNAK